MCLPPVTGFPTTTSPVTTAVPNVTPSFTNAAATGKMYLFAYGIPYYYCESSINVDLRQAINNREGDYYPRVSSSIPDGGDVEGLYTLGESLGKGNGIGIVVPELASVSVLKNTELSL